MANREVFSRTDLAREMARRRPDLHDDQALGLIDQMLVIILEQVQAGNRVSLRGFGAFYKGKSRAIKAGKVFPGAPPLAKDMPARPKLSFRQSSVVKAQIGGKRPQKERHKK